MLDCHPVRGLQIADGRSFRQKRKIEEVRKRALILSLTGCFRMVVIAATVRRGKVIFFITIV